MVAGSRLLGILQQAMGVINADEEGNGTCIFIRDGEVLRYFTDHIKGRINVTLAVPLSVSAAYLSFGGWAFVAGSARCAEISRPTDRVPFVCAHVGRP